MLNFNQVCSHLPVYTISLYLYPWGVATGGGGWGHVPPQTLGAPTCPPQTIMHNVYVLICYFARVNILIWLFVCFFFFLLLSLFRRRMRTFLLGEDFFFGGGGACKLNFNVPLRKPKAPVSPGKILATPLLVSYFICHFRDLPEFRGTIINNSFGRP